MTHILGLSEWYSGDIGISFWRILTSRVVNSAWVHECVVLFRNWRFWFINTTLVVFIHGLLALQEGAFRATSYYVQGIFWVSGSERSRYMQDTPINLLHILAWSKRWTEVHFNFVKFSICKDNRILMYQYERSGSI